MGNGLLKNKEELKEEAKHRKESEGPEGSGHKPGDAVNDNSESGTAAAVADESGGKDSTQGQVSDNEEDDDQNNA